MRIIGKLPGYVASFLGRARATASHKSVPLQVADAMLLKLAINTDFRDYHQYEFYKPGRTLEEKSRYVGLQSSRYWPYENNQPKFGIAITDKYIHKNLLFGFGLPTARLLKTIGESLEIRDIGALSEFLEHWDSEFILKPISSNGGKNILVLTPVNGHWETQGQPISVESIWQHVQPLMKRGFLIEERLRNHEELEHFYPHSLNTFRVVTIKTNDGKWHAPGCILRLGAGGNQVDNLCKGGVQLCIDENGQTYSPFIHAEQKAVSHHPDTGAELVGIKLETYPLALDLALRASQKFSFMGTIGWDVAVTRDGPMIVEGNTHWGTRFQRPAARGVITDEIAQGLRRHNALTDLFQNRPRNGGTN